MSRRRKNLIATLLAVVVAWCFVGCTSIVRAPDGPLAEPVTVLLVFDDRHRGVLFPREEGGYVEYGFGDYAWYAEMHDSWYHVFPTVLWPTQGTLGRRQVAATDVAALRDVLHWMTLEELAVERAAADAVLARLDARFADASDELVRSPAYGIDFVPDADSYWCLFNCNDAVADWLEELGCAVSWVPIRLDLAVKR